MGNCVSRGVGGGGFSSQHGGDDSPVSPARTPRGSGGAQIYRPATAGLVNKLDYWRGNFGWLSALNKPFGFKGYRTRVSKLPKCYQPVDWQYCAFRRGSPLQVKLDEVFLTREALSFEEIQAVFEGGQHAERFPSLLALIQCGLFNARHPSLAVARTPQGEEEQHSVNVAHRMAIAGREPEPGMGLSLKERFLGLREAGESLNFSNADGWTPLHFAARFGNEDAVAALFACKVKLNPRNNSGMTPLMLAVKYASPAIVERLLKGGADACSYAGADFARPLHLAVTRVGKIGCDMARLLIEIGGANPGVGDCFGKTPLHLSVSAGKEDMVHTLLDSKPPSGTTFVNCRDKQGDTPLHLAARKGGEGVVKMLLQHGADPNLANRADQTVLDTALSVGASESLIRLLKARGAIRNKTVL